MRTTYTVKGSVKGSVRASNIATGISTATEADRTAAEAVSQGATSVEIETVETDDKGESERIDVETERLQLESAQRVFSSYSIGTEGHKTAQANLKQCKAAYLAAVEAYRIARGT
jgi:hypothetical protein